MKVTDPVCGMQIDSAKAEATAVFQGETYYFCSASCQKKFQSAPERYVKKQGEAAQKHGCC